MSKETSNDKNIPAVSGENTASGFGVFGKSDLGVGVHGENEGGNVGPDRGVGVWGESKNGFGIFGSSDNHQGVSGVSKNGVGVFGINQASTTIQPDRGCGILGQTISGYAVCGISEPQGFAGRFVGQVQITGNLEVAGDIILANADCAEDFDVADPTLIEPGTVMVLGEEGKLKQSQTAYDKKVAGVISGAGTYKPGLILDKQEFSKNRMPIALMGKVYCKVDASYGAIEVGDLLTTSTTPGHAMKADNSLKAFGTVIGKALRPLAEGQGLIPVLVALQ
jgi:hypothetical protein